MTRHRSKASQGDPLYAQRNLAELILTSGHDYLFQIKANQPDFVKDRWWDEDRHWSRRPGLAERLASLTNIALTMLRLTTQNPKPQIMSDQIFTRKGAASVSPRVDT